MRPAASLLARPFCNKNDSRREVANGMSCIQFCNLACHLQRCRANGCPQNTLHMVLFKLPLHTTGAAQLCRRSASALTTYDWSTLQSGSKRALCQLELMLPCRSPLRTRAVANDVTCDHLHVTSPLREQTARVAVTARRLKAERRSGGSHVLDTRESLSIAVSAFAKSHLSG